MGNKLLWMFLVVIKESWTSFPTMEHVVRLLIGLLTYFFSTFMFATISLLLIIGLLGKPSRLPLTMDNLANLGKTILKDGIGHDGVPLQGLCVVL
jgi:hypothetical protein